MCVCSWIGQDVCNLRATDTMGHLLKYLHPEDWEDAKPKEPVPKKKTKDKNPISENQLNDFDNLHSDSDSEQDEKAADVETSLQKTIELGEHLHGVNAKKSQLKADAVDTAFDYIDGLVSWDWDDSTERGRLSCNQGNGSIAGTQ